MTSVIRTLVVALSLVHCARSEVEPIEQLDAISPDADVRLDGSGHDMTSVDMTPDLGPIAPDLSDGERPQIQSIAAQCPRQRIEAGQAWTGWGNLQYPSMMQLEVGTVSEPVFGQVWQDGVTDQPGVAAGWEAQLVVGPLGADPVSQPLCFRAVDAEFNVDDGNNDEWWVRIDAERPGLYAMYYRYRPPGGAWLYGDLNGSDDGASAAESALLIVEDQDGPDEIRAMTFNLMCRTGRWEERFELIVNAIVDADPHLIGFQEDCAADGGPAQSTEIAAQLADRLDRGFQTVRVVTHAANHPEGSFNEGISVLSAFPITASTSIDLPFANFPRKAIIADVGLGGGEALRFINTHLDYGPENEAERTQSAALIVDQIGGTPLILVGDLNTTPTSATHSVLAAALGDLWLDVGEGEGYTIPSNAPTRRIDYVWSAGLTPTSASLVDLEAAGLHASDHLGVLGRFAR